MSEELTRLRAALEQAQAAGGEVTEEMQQAYEATAERELSYKEPDEVSEAFMHALFDDEPLRRYMVVPNQKEAEWTIKQAIRELVQCFSADANESRVDLQVLARLQILETLGFVELADEARTIAVSADIRDAVPAAPRPGSQGERLRPRPG